MVKIPNNIRILKFLLENKSESFSIRELSIRLEIDYKTTYQLIDKLELSINIKKQSKSNFISFKPILTNEQYLTEQHRLNEVLNNKTLNIIYSELSQINEQFIILLFGSFAKGKQTKKSDIDLLLISENSKRIRQQLDILPLPIHITETTNKEFVLMLNSKKFSVVSEAIKNNIVLFGIGSYYRFLKNAE